jgi:hypothetical protein
MANRDLTPPEQILLQLGLLREFLNEEDNFVEAWNWFNSRSDHGPDCSYAVRARELFFSSDRAFKLIQMLETLDQLLSSPRMED